MSVAQKVVPATFQPGDSVSSGALLGDYTLCGLIFPPGWTAGAITYQTSVDNGKTWYELNADDGTAVSVPAATAPSKYFAINPDNAYLTGATMLKIRSGTVAAPVAQVTLVTVQVVGRRIYPGVS